MGLRKESLPLQADEIHALQQRLAACHEARMREEHRASLLEAELSRLRSSPACILRSRCRAPTCDSPGSLWHLAHSMRALLYDVGPLCALACVPQPIYAEGVQQNHERIGQPRHAHPQQRRTDHRALPWARLSGEHPLVSAAAAK